MEREIPVLQPNKYGTISTTHRLPRDNQCDSATNTIEINIAVTGSRYLSGNNLPRISLIRGKLFPDRYLLLIPIC